MICQVSFSHNTELLLSRVFFGLHGVAASSLSGRKTVYLSLAFLQEQLRIFLQRHQAER